MYRNKLQFFGCAAPSPQTHSHVTHCNLGMSLGTRQGYFYSLDDVIVISSSIPPYM